MNIDIVYIEDRIKEVTTQLINHNYVGIIGHESISNDDEAIGYMKCLRDIVKLMKVGTDNAD